MKCQPKALNSDFLPTERGDRTGEYWPIVTALDPHRNNRGPLISRTPRASEVGKQIEGFFNLLCFVSKNTRLVDVSVRSNLSHDYLPML